MQWLYLVISNCATYRSEIFSRHKFANSWPTSRTRFLCVIFNPISPFVREQNDDGEIPTV